MTIFIHKGLTFEANPSDSGFLRCQECNDLWCKHLAVIVKDHGDAPTIWDSYFQWKRNKVTHDFLISVQVPLFPVDHIWCKAYLTDAGYGFPALNVSFKNPNGVGFLYHDSRRQVDVSFDNLGTLQDGEARLILRTIWQAQIATVSIKSLNCHSSSHGIREQKLWEDAIKGKFVDKERWSIITSDMCSACYAKTFDSDFPDLIPDDDSYKYSGITRRGATF